MKIVGIIVGIVLVGVISGSAWFSHAINTPAHPTKDQYTLVIKKGMGVTEIGNELHAAGFITNVLAWKVHVAMSGLRSSLLPGTYKINAGSSIKEIATQLSTPPPSDNEVSVKLLEGWTAKDMADVLDRAHVISKEDFIAAVSVTDSRDVVSKPYSFLADKPATANMEGYLFPDTYRFFVHSTKAQVLQKFLDNFDTKLTASMRDQIASQHRSIFDVVTLASILEKELRTDSDRAMAADLFLRRIEAGMPLQSDATVNYVTGKNALQPTLDDTAIDSPYNTYKNKGLPIGPISNPGLSALRASINPKPNDYWFFLTELDRKTTHFAKTLDEHNANKAKYLK